MKKHFSLGLVVMFILLLVLSVSCENITQTEYASADDLSEDELNDFLAVTERVMSNLEKTINYLENITDYQYTEAKGSYDNENIGSLKVDGAIT